MPLGADGVSPMSSLPHWVVMHVPHDSMIIPENVRGGHLRHIALYDLQT